MYLSQCGSSLLYRGSAAEVPGSFFVFCFFAVWQFLRFFGGVLKISGLLRPFLMVFKWLILEPWLFRVTSNGRFMVFVAFRGLPDAFPLFKRAFLDHRTHSLGPTAPFRKPTFSSRVFETSPVCWTNCAMVESMQKTSVFSTLNPTKTPQKQKKH